MISSVMLCGLIVTGSLEAADTAGDAVAPAAYKSAAAAAGNDASAHVRLALGANRTE